MCLIAVCWRTAADAPLVLGANREEFYARGGAPPTVRPGPLPFIAGTDPLSGGTWLGVNRAGVVVAVTNRSREEVPTTPRSRGVLVADLLALSSAAEAAERGAAELATGAYAGCNLLCADANDAVVVHGGDWLRVRPLPPGVHVLANGDVNGPRDRRALLAREWLRSRRLAASEDCLLALRRLCATTDSEPAMCVRGPDRGTVCSTLLALPTVPGEGSLWHAQGPPDMMPYADMSSLLIELFGRPPRRRDFPHIPAGGTT